MRLIGTIAFALAAAASLAGCATSPAPGSVEEQLWFDHAQGYELHHTPPDLRIRGAIGYPRTDVHVYRGPPPGFWPR